MEIIAITVSTNYEDYLRLIIQENLQFFKKWYIVTDEKDLITQELCKPYDAIETILFKFQSGSKIFNKGGGIRKAQQEAYKNCPNSLFLILDSDVCLTTEMVECIKKTKIQEDCIYGADRIMIPSIKDYFNQDHSSFKLSTWQNKKVPSKIKWWNKPWGYFQLYKTPHLYKDSTDAGKVDVHFSHCFSKNENLPIAVKHIGLPSLNWQGRKTQKENI